MTKEELERLYMDIYDNGILDYSYKEKFKRYVNYRLESLENENAELKEEMKAKQVVLNDFRSRVETVTDRFNKKSSQLNKANELLMMCRKYHFHPELTEYPFNEVEAFLEETNEII